VGVDDYVNSEAGVVAAATAAAVSPRARELFRRGAVYGLAGVMKATDVAVTAARGAVDGARQGAAAASSATNSSGGSSSRSTGSGRRTQGSRSQRRRSTRKQTGARSG
jgi:hypothetical protein